MYLGGDVAHQFRIVPFHVLQVNWQVVVSMETDIRQFLWVSGKQLVKMHALRQRCFFLVSI